MLQITPHRPSEGSSLFDRLGGRPGIDALLRPFYADVRQHNVIGPIFNQQIHDWTAHLDRIGEFWALQTGGPSRYNGGFAGAHLPLDLQPEHFQHWLGLWELNCRRRLSSPEADAMIALAQEFARRLKRVIASSPRPT